MNWQFPVIVFVAVALGFLFQTAKPEPDTGGGGGSGPIINGTTDDDYEDDDPPSDGDDGVSKIIPFTTPTPPVTTNSSKPENRTTTEAPKPPAKDYYDEEEEEVSSPEEASPSSSSTTTITTSSTVAPKVFSVIGEFPPGNDFEPKFGGRIIPRTELNLTDSAKKVQPIADYYDEDYEEEATDDHDDDEEETDEKSAPEPSNNDNEEEENDPKGPTGHLPDILDRLLRGPTEKEVNKNSRPEDIYLYINRLITGETNAMVKETIPRVYDYQYPVGDRISQRCFNSLGMMADKMRQGHLWPMKMLGASGTISAEHMALRSYGQFDRCLDVITENVGKDSSLFYVGQYCLVEMLLPLPKRPNPTEPLRYSDRILNFTSAEITSSFADFMVRHAPFLYSNPLSMGICVPSTCSGLELESAIDYFLLKFRIKIRFTSDCYTKLNLTREAFPEDDLSEESVLARWQIEESLTSKIGWILANLNAWQVFALLYLICSIALVLLATIYEIYRIHQTEQQQTSNKSWMSTERNRPKSFVACFSARYNIEQIFMVRYRYQYQELMQHSDHNQQRTDQQLGQDLEDFVMTTTTTTTNESDSPYSAPNTGSLDTFKCLGLLWICLANYFLLGYQPQMLPSIAHVSDLIPKMDRTARYQPILQSWLSFELFFMISGFLMAYTSLPKISRHDGQPKLSFFFLKRLIRFFPSMLFILLAIHLLPLWSNAGPIYNSSVERLLRPCTTTTGFWTTLLFVGNLFEIVDNDHLCMPQFWYVSMDYQLTILGVFVLVFVHNRHRHSLKTFITLIIIGCLVSGYQAYRLQIRLGRSIVLNNAILSEIPGILARLHFSPVVHFSSYFLGMALGYRVRMSKIPPFNVSWIIRIVTGLSLITIASLVLYIPCIWANIRPSDANDNRDRNAAVIYYGLARLLFVSSSTYIVSQLLYRKNVITNLFSWSLMRLGSHLSFQIYLWNLVIIWIYLFTKRSLINTDFTDSFLVGLSLFILTAVWSIFTFILFEAPYRSLFRYYFESPRTITCSDGANGTDNHHHQMMTTLKVHGATNNGTKRDCNGNQLQRTPRMNMNPNFLFSPHYNSIHDRSETSSCISFPTGNDSRRQSVVELQVPETSKINEAFEIDHDDHDHGRNGNHTVPTG